MFSIRLFPHVHSRRRSSPPARDISYLPLILPSAPAAHPCFAERIRIDRWPLFPSFRPRSPIPLSLWTTPSPPKPLPLHPPAAPSVRGACASTHASWSALLIFLPFVRSHSRRPRSLLRGSQ